MRGAFYKRPGFINTANTAVYWFVFPDKGRNPIPSPRVPYFSIDHPLSVPEEHPRAEINPTRCFHSRLDVQRGPRVKKCVAMGTFSDSKSPAFDRRIRARPVKQITPSSGSHKLPYCCEIVRESSSGGKQTCFLHVSNRNKRGIEAGAEQDSGTKRRITWRSLRGHCKCKNPTGFI